MAVGLAVVMPSTNETWSHGTDGVAESPLSVPAPAFVIAIVCAMTGEPR